MGAHPRVCGENLTSRLKACSVLGSSPRVRGKLRGRVNVGDSPRLIPACAGKTHSRRVVAFGHWAHPRVCGENVEREEFLSPVSGSSPRVRGKPNP